MPSDIITPATGARMIADAVILFDKRQIGSDKLAETISTVAAGVYRAGFEEMRAHSITEIIKAMR